MIHCSKRMITYIIISMCRQAPASSRLGRKMQLPRNNKWRKAIEMLLRATTLSFILHQRCGHRGCGENEIALQMRTTYASSVVWVLHTELSRVQVQQCPRFPSPPKHVQVRRSTRASTFSGLRHFCLVINNRRCLGKCVSRSSNFASTARYGCVYWSCCLCRCFTFVFVTCHLLSFLFTSLLPIFIFLYSSFPKSRQASCTFWSQMPAQCLPTSLSVRCACVSSY